MVSFTNMENAEPDERCIPGSSGLINVGIFIPRAYGIAKERNSYLLHPYILLPTLALSTSTIDNTLFLATLYLASKGLIDATKVIGPLRAFALLSRCQVTVAFNSCIFIVFFPYIHSSCARYITANPIRTSVCA